MDLGFFEKQQHELDDLTGVYERQEILSYMEYLITNNINFTFALLDVDNFKFVNDNYGHLVGDEVLKIVAKSVKEVTKDFGVVGRYGGDEFIFVFPEISEYDDTWQSGYKILKSTIGLEIPCANNLSISYTIGLSRYPLNSTNIDELFTLADKALYRGKIKGRNCFIIYMPEKHANIDLLTKRDKLYSPMYINSKIYNMVTSGDNLKESIQNVINYIGSYLMLEHVCIETKDKLIFNYNHPLAKRTEPYKPFGYSAIGEKTDSTGTFYENVVLAATTCLHFDLYKAFLEQKIYASYLSQIKAFGKVYGYLRVDMVATDTGRIWQQNDLVILTNLTNLIGLALYAKNEDLD